MGSLPHAIRLRNELWASKLGEGLLSASILFFSWKSLNVILLDQKSLLNTNAALISMYGFETMRSKETRSEIHARHRAQRAISVKEMSAPQVHGV